MEKPIDFRVARATSVLMLISIAGKLLGFAREQVIAAFYGATRLTDAYVTAFALPQMIALLVGGAVSTALIVVFSRFIVADDDMGGWRLIGTVSRLAFHTLLLLTLFAFFAAPWLIRLLAPRFTIQEQASTVAMLRIMLPAAVFLGMTAIFSAALNALKRFTAPALASLLVNMVIIGGVMFLANQVGITALAWATLAGTLLSLVFMLYQMRKAHTRWFQSANSLHPEVAHVVRLAAPILLGSVFGQFHMIVDKALASGLAAGSIAALNYATKLVQLPVGIFASALSTAIYPTLAESASRQDRQKLRKDIIMGLRLLSLVMVPAAVGLVALGKPIVSLAFERGSFDSLATTKTATALVFYALGVVGLANQQILIRGFYVISDSVTPVTVGIGTSLLNVGLAMWLVKPLQHGGIALANSIASLTNMVILIVLLERRIGSTLDVVPSLIRSLVAASVMGVLVMYSYLWLAFLGQIMSLAASVIVGLVTYITLTFALDVDEIRLLSRMARKAMTRNATP